MIDTVADHAVLQPENSIIIRPWEARGGADRGLVDLIPFLECAYDFIEPDKWPDADD